MVPRTVLPSFKHPSQKLKEEFEFKVDFWGIAIQVRVRNVNYIVIVYIFKIKNLDNFSNILYLFILKKFLAADIILNAYIAFVRFTATNELFQHAVLVINIVLFYRSDYTNLYSWTH